MKIPYKAFGFIPPLAASSLNVSWAEIVWAAVTYGKSSSCYYLKHPGHSRAEKKYRTYLLYTCLKKNGQAIAKSSLYEGMDPTEKAAASYFLGMTLTKLFAARLLGAPLLWHVTTSSQAISYSPGKSRPDLIGCCQSISDWIVAEAKGRSGPLDGPALSRAKTQSQMITTINGVAPKHRFGSQSYFAPNLCMAMDDPPAEIEAFPIEIDVNQALAEYYSIVSELITSGTEETILGVEYITTQDADLGVTVGLPADLVRGGPDKMAPTCLEIPQPAGQPVSPLEHLGADGYFIRLDRRWAEQEMEKDPNLRDG